MWRKDLAGKMARMSTGERPTLDRELLAETALKLIDRDGLAALSMRKLGAELGVEAMSLYHYVKNKDDLLDSVLDRLYTEVDVLPKDSGIEWEAAIRHGLRSLHDVLIRHPASVELFSSRPARSQESIAKLFLSYQNFAAGGLEGLQAFQAFRFAVAYVLGHSATELGVLAQLKVDPSWSSNSMTDPALQQFVDQSGSVPGSEMFENGLDLVIGGLRSVYNLPPGA